MAVVKLSTGEISRTSTSLTRRLGLTRSSTQPAASATGSRQANDPGRARLKALEKDMNSEFVLEVDADTFLEDGHRKKRQRRKRPRLNAEQVLKDDWTERGIQQDKSPNYFTAKAPASKYPPRHFCGVCGHIAPYTCPRCSARYCAVKCLRVHEDQRCLKFIQ
eukprot:TRINITY_DN97873_c0_g1_i1.p2 TRINITY_DN97873_c0_g1~~TRINITY_DN97873_c0_g1_i1.p2  ORF type:complete len:163 (-),score=17.87 TRINITY_DN97873_c0_g1_i1:43-531(-)